MQKYILRRLFHTLVALLVGTLVIFLLARLSGDPTQLLLPIESATPAAIAEMKAKLGLDRSLIVQYYTFLGNALHGDFGESIVWGKPAMGLVLSYFPATAELATLSCIIALILAIPVGMVCAVKRDSISDRLGKTVALIGQSIPTFWLGMMLVLFFAVTLHVLPPAGRGGVTYVIMLALTLAAYTSAALLRLTRSAMLDVLASEYIQLAHIKGVWEWQVIVKHALKNASIPIITLAGLQLSILLSGAVVTEMVFNWPGVGRLVVNAVFSRDYPVIQAATMVIMVIMVACNFIVDVAYVYIDPRVRYQ